MINQNLMISNTNKAQPFLKWVGGKRNILDLLNGFFPNKFNKYYEPFVGGGSVLFFLNPERATVSDVNSELINVYRVVAEKPLELINRLKAVEIDGVTEEFYYYLRKQNPKDDVEKASRTIILNKTCFNGLYRVNSKGEFNVSFGKRKCPELVNETSLMACHDILSRTDIFCQSYEKTAEMALEGDFVYFDPPYVTNMSENRFVNYTKGGFGFPEHLRLRDLCVNLDGRGVKWVLSNSAVDDVYELYQGFNIHTFSVSRRVGGVAKTRNSVQEVIIYN